MASNLRVDSIVPATGSSVSIGTATGGVNIPGVLTYEDVTNVDSVGVITARSGIKIGATGANTLISGTATGIGIGTDSPGSPLEVNGGTSVDTATFNSHNANGVLINLQRSGSSKGFLGSGKNIADATGGVDDIGLRSQANLIFTAGGGTERLRINSSGYIKLSGRNVQGSANGDKLLRIFQPSRTDAEEDVLLLQSYNQSGTNSIIIGGGDSSFNAATDISFRTAAINTTSGTERLRIQNGGLRMNGGAYIMEVTGGSGAPNNANRQMDQRRWLWYGTSSTTHTVARVAKASSGQPGDGDSQLAAWIVTYTARSMYGFNSDGGYSVMKMRTGRFDYNDDEVRFSTEQDTLGTGGGGQNPTIVFTDEGSGVVRISITNPSSTHSFGEINLMTYDCRITLPTG